MERPMSIKETLINSTAVQRPVSDEDTYINSAAVQDRYKISDATLFRWERDQELGFPQPLILNRRKLYRLAELVAWERSRAAVARRTGRAAA
jgi:hypothetical protein